MQSTHLIDYHMHTMVTVDAKMTEVQACERAISLGLQEIAFTNHVMFIEPGFTISHEALAKHWEQIQACQERCPELTLRLGLEVDYFEGQEEEIYTAIKNYEKRIGRPFDLVLGAIHHLNGVFFSSPDHAPKLFDGQDVVKVYHDYFALATKAVQSRLYDIMAHPDLVKKYTGDLSPHLPFEQYQAAVEPYIDALLASGVGIEVNTRGFDLFGSEPYPSEELLGLYLSRARASGKNPVITLGSDAHKAADVGNYIPEGAGVLRKMGQYTIMRFEKRKPSPIQI